LRSVAETIRDRRCILFAGSGLSRNAGLPTWAELGSAIAAELHREGVLTEDARLRVQPYLGSSERALAALGLLVEETSRRHVVRVLRTVLSRTTSSKVYPLLKEMHLRGAITTNYDRLLEPIFGPDLFHLNNALSRLSLAPIAVNSPSPFLFKVHGDIDDEHEAGSRFVARGEGLMVITRGDFDAIVQGERGEALRLAFHSILQQYSLLFIGYSFTDPDITWILRFLVENIKFPHDSWFLTRRGENTSHLPAGINPLADLGNWSELPDWLESLLGEVRSLPRVKAKAATEHAPAGLPDEAHRRALLALSRFLETLKTEDLPERVLAAAFFDAIAGESSVTRSWLETKVETFLEVGPGYADPLAQATIGYLMQLGVLGPASENAHPVDTSRVAAIRESASHAWVRDRERFYASVTRRIGSATSGLSKVFQETFDLLLQDLCIEFGQSMAEWVQHGMGSETGWGEAKVRAGQVFRPGTEDLRVAERVLDLILTSPQEGEAPYLYRLLSASFMAGTVRLDPTAAAALRTRIASYEMFLDTNILLPLVVREHEDHAAVRDILEASRAAGVKLFVTRAMFDEIVGHRGGAQRTAEENQGSIPDLMLFAETYGLRSNCFIQGYISSLSIAERREGRAAGGSDLASWRSYIAKYAQDRIADTIEGFGIEVVSPRLSEPLRSDYDYILQAISDEWASRPWAGDRAPILNENEATQFLYIYQRRSELAQRGSPPEVWFLSNETLLARVFRRDAGRWEMPPTFRFSAWAAFLNARLQVSSRNPRAVVSVMLKANSSAFDLPDAETFVRRRLVGERVATRVEAEAINVLMSAHGVVTGLDQALAAVRRRGASRLSDTKRLAGLGVQTAEGVESELQQRFRSMAEEYERLKTEVASVRATTAEAGAAQRREAPKTSPKPWNRAKSKKTHR